jgi:hypothetical protein
MTPDDQRWSIWIDIEGFSKLWFQGGVALSGLRQLMSGIHAIGNRSYPDDGERIFAHQFGDGFVIISDFHEPNLDRAASIAVALVRHVTRSGCMARAAIAEGEFCDYSGCWPPEIMAEQASNGDDTVRLGSGLMTFLPVMGTALINAHKLDAANPANGAIVTIETRNSTRLSSGFQRSMVGGAAGFTAIDWVHSRSKHLDRIVEIAGIGTGREAELEAAINRYIDSYDLPSVWIENTLRYNSTGR